ncbi:MAG TPA: Smr/MutS family protein [Polyangiaceae bacterium]|nr:Smr/MutS family protein [Polyangiaceae bacterium]
METSPLAKGSLDDLEWPELLACIAGYTSSALGRARVLALGPAAEQSTAETRARLIGEALTLHGEGAPLPSRSFDDPSDGVERARRFGVLSAEELWHVLGVIDVATDIARFGRSHAESAPTLASAFELSDELAPLQRTLRRAIDAGGTLRDDASPALRDARREVKQLRRQVQARIGELITRYRDALQDGYFAERDGRYVLPVRGDAPYRVEGIVLGTSSSGATLYVEPRELGALGQQLRLAEVEVEREEARVLAELSGELAPLADELLWAVDIAARADLVSAAVRFATRTGSRVLPFSTPGELRLIGARHPILAHGTREVVPSDLSVSHGHGLVLSGPNAGGKTVALKCLGLCALLQSSGLPLPAEEGSRVGWFDRVYCDIGDDQSLSMSLSTFSGHVERMRDILEESGPRSLVLVDELMSGTDPDEGAVLAIATLDEFVRRGAALVVTTHYEPLKNHAAQQDYLDNAAVGFDFERMEPTFRVEQGRPGASSALLVAQRHGLPRNVTRQAEALLPEVDARKRSECIELEQLRARMDREQRELREEMERQRLATRRLEDETEKLRETRRSDIARESDELRRAVREARNELKQVRAKVKDSTQGAELREAERRIDGLSSVIALGSDAERAARKAAPAPPSFEPRPGMKVRVAGLNTPAEVLEVPEKGPVRVVAGVLKLSVKREELSPWTANAAARAEARPTPSRTIQQSKPVLPARREVPLKAQDTTLDLRGWRVEAALLEVDGFLDELLRRQELGGYVLHGHGTGAMKTAVRDHLRGHPCVAESRPAERDEGGDAFTVVWLRDIG